MARIRLTLMGAFFFLGFAVVLFRAGRLQLLPNQNLEQISDRQINQQLELVGRRGVIADRNGRELSISVNSASIFVNPKLLKNKKEAIRVLARIMEMSEKEVNFKFQENANRKFFWFSRQLDKAQMARLKNSKFSKIEGIGLIPEFRREFPNKSLAAHVLGFVSVDGEGIEGVERQFNDELLGMNQKIKLTRDALGRPLFSHVEQIQLEQNQGSRIELTIDSRIQHFSEKVLKETVTYHGAQSGSVVVMDPFNGEILAMANYPTYDPNFPKQFPVSMRRNRLLTDPIEPGSVLKPFVVAKALEERVVNVDTVIPTFGGKIKVKDKTISESDAKHSFESMTVKDVVRLSSNVGMVVLKDKIGFNKVDKMYRDLGFSQKTGIELSGESKGLYKTPSDKQLVEQATLSFGQGISLTTLQIANAYSVFANGGHRVQPHIIKNISGPSIDGDGINEHLFSSNPIELKGRVLSESTVEKMRSLLEKVVQEEGTGIAAKVEGFSVAGKTGTSQKVDFVNGGYKQGAYWSLFSGFVPSRNPRFVIVVMIDEPTNNGYYGGKVAAPAFAKIAREAIRTLGIQRNSVSPLAR